MKYRCTTCDRTAAAKNLFCPELDCPAELAPTIFEPGERLGDIEIARAIVSTPSATLYDAVHQRDRVFLKVAAPGAAHRERLIREANFLRTLVSEKRPPPAFPRLRPPYVTTTVAHDPYGRMVLQGELQYFYVTDPAEGHSLRDLLLKQPQWWVNHVGWLSIELALAVNELHLRGMFHLAMTPASVLVRFDVEPNVPHIFLWDLGIASDRQSLIDDWYPELVPAAYCAPELLTNNGHGPSASIRSDVYGLGLVLYEMLVGQPAVPYRLVDEARVRAAVVADWRVEMDRVEDVAPVAQVTLRASAVDPEARQNTAADIAEQLITLVGSVPKKKRAPWLDTTLVVIAAVGVLALLISVAFALGQ
ncbi:MAG TPA: protein kinase [Chloroflexota bacterium]